MKTSIKNFASNFAKIFFSCLLALGTLAGGVLVLSTFAFFIYIFGDAEYPGDLLVWVSNPRVLATLLFLVILASINTPVKNTGKILWLELLEKAEKKFSAL